MFGRSRDAVPGAHDPVPGRRNTWTGSLVRADRVVLTGRRGRRADGVRITIGELTADFPLLELVGLVDGTLAIAESVTTPLTFLAGPGAAAPTSAAAEWTARVPGDAVTVLVEPMDAPPPAVLTGAELDGFSSWVRALVT